MEEILNEYLANIEEIAILRYRVENMINELKEINEKIQRLKRRMEG